METPIVSAGNLSRSFGQGHTLVKAVRDVDLAIAAGEIVLVMGPSGSGKTTLLTMLGGLLRPDSGSILIDGVDIVGVSERRLPAFRARRFGFIFQDFNLIAALTARENVQVALDIAGAPGRVSRGRAIELLCTLGLDDRLNFPVEQLSGGEKQRVAIARAIANRPLLILADEPTANLDSGHGAEIMRMLRALVRENGAAVVIASHDERLRQVADRVLWLEDGRLRQLADLVTDPSCGMLIDPEVAPAHAVVDDREWWFCSTGCRDQHLNGLAAAGHVRP